MQHYVQEQTLLLLTNAINDTHTLLEGRTQFPYHSEPLNNTVNTRVTTLTLTVR